jgi:hypothetical protein
MHRSQRFCHFLNATWKLCSERVFNTACDSASISMLGKTAAFQFYFQLGKRRKVGWVGNSDVAFGRKNSLVKEKV